MAEQAPEHQDRGLFGLFGKKKEDQEGMHDDQIMQPPASHTHNEPQTEAASYYPTPPQHGVEHGHGHGHEGQLTPEEAEQQKHTKLHGTHGSSSSSSSDEEEEGGKKKEGGRKKKGTKEKTKEKLPGDGQPSSDEYAVEEKKKAGLLDKIKEKLPGKHSSEESRIEEEKKVDNQSRLEEEKKVSLLDKIKEKLPGHHKKEGEE
uniref:Dehydrin 3 n=1 Tax=Larix kaempferi TaxID=54800 RepID=A0A8U0LSE1_9CONI|nr:dehydrin 3 [Larix kaempferi]